MQASAQLKELLHSINRKSYPAYKSLRGAYQFDRYILSIDHVQGDPFASPSHISVKLSHRDTGFPAEYYKDSLTRITLGDFLNRQFEQQVNRYTFRAKGSGKSGLISVSHCGQEVLARTACEITEKGITARFFHGFPANGRTINSPELEKILFDFLPVCVHKAFFYRNLDADRLKEAIELAEDQEYIRRELAKRSLAALCKRWGHPSQGKRHLFPPDEKFRSLCFSGKPADFHGSAPQRNHHRHGHSLRHHIDRRRRLPWQIYLA